MLANARLTSNLRQDHPRMRAFSYACSHTVTWQRWRLYHSIRHTRKPHAARKRHRSMFDRTGVICRSKFYIAVTGIFDLFRPCDLDLDIWTRAVFLGDIPHVQIWTSYVKAFKSYCLTDTTKIIIYCTMPLCRWSKIQQLQYVNQFPGNCDCEVLIRYQ